jgi:hypothetical protein
MRKTLIDATETFADIPIVSDIVPLHPDNITRAAFQAYWGVTTGAWKVEVSNDERVWPGSSNYDATNGKWFNVTSIVGVDDPDGAEGIDWVEKELVGGWLRVTLTPSAPGAAAWLKAVFVEG